MADSIGHRTLSVLPDLIGHLNPVDSEREPRPAKKNGANPVA